MPNADIWVATWNCENQAPSTVDLNNFIANEVLLLAPAAQPDIIVIALQEAVESQLLGDNGWVSQRVAARLFHSGYSEIMTEDMKGRTKRITNYQQIGLIAKTGLNINNMESGQRRATFTSPFQSYQGKGGVFLNCHLNIGAGPPLRLGFAGCHLQSTGTDESRFDLFNNIMRKLGGAFGDRDLNTRLDDETDLIFATGDFNCRLRYMGHPNGQPSANNFITHYTGVNVQNLAHDLNNAADILNLWNRYEPLHTQMAGILPVARLDQPNNHPVHIGFNFPTLAAPFMPTYKRAYANNAAINRQQCLDIPTRAPGNAIRQSDIYGCYLSHQAHLIKDRNGGVLNIGWLDQVGYRINNNTLHAGGVTVVVNAYEDKPNHILSDHVPVVMKTTVNW